MNEIVRAKNQNLLLDTHSRRQLLDLAYRLKALGISRLPKDEIAKIIVNCPEFQFKTLEEIEAVYKDIDRKRILDAYSRAAKDLYERTVEVSNPNYELPCRNFTGATNHGYGEKHILDKVVGTHTLSYAISKGITIEEIPRISDTNEPLVICHGKGCDCLCIEPTHLTLETQRENTFTHRIRDGTTLRGVKHPNAKISEEQATLIKQSRGEGTMLDRAHRFGVEEYIVKNIDRGRAWAHIPDKNGEVTDTLDMRNKMREHTQKNKRDIDFTESVCSHIQKRIKKNTTERMLKPELETPCWIWKNRQDVSKYYTMSYKCITFALHILAHKVFVNEKHSDPGKPFVLHKCAIRACCNPDHLYLGDKKDNGIDAVKDGHKNVKLTTEQVIEIRNAEGTHKSIGERYGVCGSTIGAIKNGKRWSWLE